MTECKPLSVVALAVVISACAVAGCGGGSKSAPATPSSAASTSANATTAGYRKALEQGVTTLSSDVNTFITCTDGFTPAGCRSWAVGNKGLTEQFLKLLEGAQVPASDARDDAALRTLLHRIGTSDEALVKAIDSGKGRSAAVQALTAKIRGSEAQLVPVLNRLDPGVQLNIPG